MGLLRIWTIACFVAWMSGTEWAGAQTNPQVNELVQLADPAQDDWKSEALQARAANQAAKISEST